MHIYSTYHITNLPEHDASLADIARYRLRNDDVAKVIELHRPVPGKAEGVEFDIYDFEMLFNDPGTRELMRTGRTIGCFYIESPGMRSLLTRLNCDTFEMLTAASSIIRPGVAESGMMREFIERHKNPRKRKYLVPEMKKYLGETYGVMVYQEDVIKVAHHIAGLSLEEADLLRRAMSGKLRSREAMQQMENRFFASCKKRGLSDYVTKELWRQIASFAGYSFCKAHSASFALLSFQVAYLKVHYPAEFMAGVLSNRGGYYSAAVYIQECRRMGLRVYLPCINESAYEYVGRGRNIRIGLMAIKHLSRNAMDTIIEERTQNGKYVSLADFLIRTRLAYEETAMLIRCGAMDSLGQTRPTLLRLLDIYLNRRKILDEQYNNLFMHETFQLEEEITTDRDYSIEQRCLEEQRTFDYMVSRHPLEFFTEYTNTSDITGAAHIRRMHGKRVKMIGWYMTAKRIKTKNGKIMKFLSLEDLTGTFEAVLFPETYNKFAEKTMTLGPYIIEGVVDADNGNNIIVGHLETLSNARIKTGNQWDSAENKYYGDVEKVSDEEFTLVKALGKEKLRIAYAG